MKDFSIPMALVDFIPVCLFAAATVLLMRDLYNKMSKGAFALFSAGMINVLGAGALKATYKLLYAAGICDFEPLSQMFFPVQAIGFLLAGIGTIPLLNLNHFGACLLAGEAQLPFAIFMSVLTTVVAYLLYTNGLKGLDNGKASIIASIEPVMASVVGLVVYGEAMTTMGVLGMVLVLFSCFLAGKEEK